MTTINNTEVTIDTVATPAKIGEIILSADRRSTKEKPLTDAQRIRRAILPANYWGNLEASAISATGEVTKVQGLTDVLMNGLRGIANARLKDSLDENPMLRTIALKDYTVSALLAWSEETAASRGALTFDRDAVLEWFPKTKLHAAMVEKGTQFVELVQNRLAALAAKNHGLKKAEDAEKLIVLLADDAENGICPDIIARLAHISKSLAARTAETTLSLDDL
jgi:hypothetical protein